MFQQDTASKQKPKMYLGLQRLLGNAYQEVPPKQQQCREGLAYLLHSCCKGTLTIKGFGETLGACLAK